MNLSKIARDITLKEGKKHSLNIADVKEVLKIVFTDYSYLELMQIKRKYGGGEKNETE